MAVLLIGSTGSGKSTLGNFLLDPDDVRTGGKHFEVARANYSQTQEVKTKSMPVKLKGGSELEHLQPVFTAAVVSAPLVMGALLPALSTITSKQEQQLTIIDTPGLNESNVADLSHNYD